MAVALRSTTIAGGRDHLSRLTYYHPGAEQPEHEHETSQVSILLLGSLQESVQGERREISAPHLCLKPEGTAHSNRFGPCGALVLSIRFERATEQRDVICRKGWGWLRLRSLHSASELAAYGSPALLSRTFEDLREPKAKAAPDWLCSTRASLEIEPGRTSIADLADSIGVHRVHLSRAFNDYYGMTPSAFRLRQMAALALERMIQARVPAAFAAHEAGFADQSHMVRTIRQATGGLTPGHILRAFG